MRFIVLGIVLFSYLPRAKGQTVVSAVVDAASYAPRVAPGELATIFGSNLANGTQGATGFPLPKTMAGATVYVNSAPVPLLYVSNTQINFQVPRGLATGIGSLYVSRSGGTSAVFQFVVTASDPGIFQDTSNHAIAQNAADYSQNSSSNPVKAGDYLIVYLTGQGAVDNPVSDGAATPSSPLATATATATATIGGVNAPVQFVGLTPGFVGLAQVNVQVPSSLASADYPLVLTVGGFVSASTIVSVSGSGTAPPVFLTQAGQVNFPNDLSSSIAIYGGAAYLCGPNRISVVNISDPTNPTYVGEFGDAQLLGNGGKCAIDTLTQYPILVDLVGPGTSPSFAVYNLSSPGAPAFISQIPILPLSTAPASFPVSISFDMTTGAAFVSTSWYQTSGNYIAAQYGYFLAYSFSTLSPLPLGVLSSGAGSSGLNPMPNSLVLNPSSLYSDTAYITSTTATGGNTNGYAALDVVDLSSLQSLQTMQSLGQVIDSSAAIYLGFGYSSDLLLVTGNTTGYRNPGIPNFSINGNLTLTTMNITNVQNPVIIATTSKAVLGVGPAQAPQIPTSGTYVVQPFFSSDVFAIVNNPPATDPVGPYSLWIVDASSSSKPILYPFSTAFGMSDVYEYTYNSNGYLLVPNVDGLTIYSINLP